MSVTRWEACRRRVGLRPHLTPTEQGDRLCVANSPDAGAAFCDNTVITSRYTAWNFLPLFLMEQFSRAAK